MSLRKLSVFVYILISISSLTAMQEVRHFAHTSKVTSIAISPDNKLIAAGSAHGDIKIWPLDESTEPVKVLAGHSVSVYHLRWAPLEPHLFSCSADGSVRKWNAVSGKLIPPHLQFEAHTDPHAVWADDGIHLAYIYCYDGAAKQYAINVIDTKQPVDHPSRLALAEGTNFVRSSLTWHKAQQLAVIADARQILIWHFNSDGSLASSQECNLEGAVHALAWCPKADSATMTYPRHTRHSAIAWNSDGAQLAAAGKAGVEITTGDSLVKLSDKGASCVAWGDDTVAFEEGAFIRVFRKKRDRNAKRAATQRITAAAAAEQDTHRNIVLLE